MSRFKFWSKTPSGKKPFIQQSRKKTTPQSTVMTSSTQPESVNEEKMEPAVGWAQTTIPPPLVNTHRKLAGSFTSLLLHDETLLQTTINTAKKLNGTPAGISIENLNHEGFMALDFSHSSKNRVTLEWTVFCSSTLPITRLEDTLIIEAKSNDALPNPQEYAQFIWCTLYWYFHLPPPDAPPQKPGAPIKQWKVQIGGGAQYESLLVSVERMGLIYNSCTSAQKSRTDTFFTLKRTFWQIPPDVFYRPVGVSCNLLAYHSQPLHFGLPVDNSRHPLRPKPPAPGTMFYKRYIPSLNSYLTFRTANMETDVPLLHKWMNNPRVDAFWGEAGPETHQHQFLQKGLEDHHCFPVIGSWRDLSATDSANGKEGKEICSEEVPFGYFEIYWVKEDRLAGYTKTADWDRGVHVLVGEERFRGYHRVQVWLSSLVHYMFLSDPRTMTLILEPRVDNEKFINYLMRVGFYKEKEFSFPHKQAAVMKLKREAWDGPAC